MTDDNGKNKREFEDIDKTRSDKTKKAEKMPPIDDKGETKTFDAVGDAAAQEQTVDFKNGINGGKAQISIDGSGKEPLERCEERGSVKSYTTASLIWRIVRPVLILGISAALLFYLGSLAYRYIEDSYFSPVDAQTSLSKSIEIKPGSSLSTISRVLFDEGIIRNKFVFQMYVDLQDMGSSLLAGEYDFSPSMTMDDIVKILGEGGEARAVIKVTFTEGMTVKDIADTLLNNEVLNESETVEFLELCNDKEELSDYKFLDSVLRQDESERVYLLEGYLFPDTYEIYADAKPSEIIKKLLTRFDDIFTLDYEDKATELGMSIDEVMALASMIEWESLPEDFKKVSAVFHNRLEQEKRLESCATLRYVTGEKKLVYSEEERSIESAYNTYRIPGLPIGPVANPGEKAINAALYPSQEYMEEDYLFFRNAAPDSGKLVFAKSLEEHEENTRIYEELAQALEEQKQNEG